MGISGTIAALAGAGSLGLGIYGATQGPPANNVQIPPPLPGVQNAGLQSQGLTGNLGGYNLYDPQNFSNVSYGLFNNPYASGVQGAAGQAGPLAQQGGLNTYGAGANLFGGSNALLGTAFDPQQALYNRTIQQLQDQQRTANAAAGVATTPYGAGLEGQTLSNFNIDWQNQQLARQLQGLQGAAGGYGQASNLQSAGPQQYLQGASMPYSTFQNLGANQLGALTGLQGYGQAGAQIPQQQIADYTQYALGGQGLANQGAQVGLNQSQLASQQMAGYGNEIGWGLGMLSNQRLPTFGWGGGSPGYFGSYGGTGGGLGGLY